MRKIHGCPITAAIRFVSADHESITVEITSAQNSVGCYPLPMRSLLRTGARLGGLKANEKRHHCPFHRSEALGMPTLPIKLPGNMR